jgi:hypothetical protein
LIIRSQVSIGQRNQTSIQNYPAPDLLSFDFGENALPNRSVDQFDINNSTLTTYGPLNQGQVRYPFVYQTRINNNDYGILVQEWTSKISRARFLFYIFPLDPAETFGLSNYINSLLNSGSGLVPVISYSDNNLCLSDTNSDKTYCSWYESQHTKTLKLAQKWKRNGFIPFEMGKYLFRMQTINY